jgi:hypothetical protein
MQKRSPIAEFWQSIGTRIALSTIKTLRYPWSIRSGMRFIGNSFIGGNPQDHDPIGGIFTGRSTHSTACNSSQATADFKIRVFGLVKRRSTNALADDGPAAARLRFE